MDKGINYFGIDISKDVFDQGKLILFFLINKLVEKVKSCQFECFEVRKMYREQAFFVLDTNFQKRKFTRTDKSYKPILN